eukprot:1183946-Prorocentrum_minimum.AAC.3
MQGQGTEIVKEPPRGDTTAEDDARKAGGTAVETAPPRGEGNETTQHQEGNQTEGSAATTSYFGSYFGSMKKYTGQVGTTVNLITDVVTYHRGGSGFIPAQGPNSASH